jgi:hypothetical protein
VLARRFRGIHYGNGVFTDMEGGADIYRRVLGDGPSGREYKIHWKTLRRILRHLQAAGIPPRGAASAGDSRSL